MYSIRYTARRAWVGWRVWSNHWILFTFLCLATAVCAQTDSVSQHGSNSSSIQWQYIGIGTFTGFMVISLILLCIQLRIMQQHRTGNNSQPILANGAPAVTQNADYHVVNMSFLDATYPSHLYHQDEQLTLVKVQKAEQDHQSKDLRTLFENHSDLTCAICLEDFIDKISPVRQLACHHIFHTSCIDRWLTTRSTLCPLCKYPCVRRSDSNDDHSNVSSVHVEPTASPMPPPTQPSPCHLT